MGCRNVLITGADQSTKDVINVLYTAEGGPVEFAWERLPGTYHGSGCTLASSIAIFLARNQDVVNAVKDAQEYTWNALKKGIQLGRAQIHPTRNF
jgi:hydroxymethylpyrimidine/phosphomethylpyrimidine kinase